MNYTTNGSNGILVDTNILIYVHDPGDRTKQRIAFEVLDYLFVNERVVLSTQCLTEFFNAATRRLPQRMEPVIATRHVERLARAATVFDLTPQVVLEGCRGVVDHQLSFWDSLIWAAARLNQVPLILTEDSTHGRYLEGVTYLDPFDSAFSVTQLG